MDTRQLNVCRMFSLTLEVEGALNFEIGAKTIGHHHDGLRGTVMSNSSQMTMLKYLYVRCTQAQDY